MVRHIAFSLTLVVLIRATNFPVLLIVALYERRQYSDTTIMEELADFTERYVGSIPRKLTAAGEHERSIVLAAHFQLDLTTLGPATTLTWSLKLSEKSVHFTGNGTRTDLKTICNSLRPLTKRHSEMLPWKMCTRIKMWPINLILL